MTFLRLYIQGSKFGGKKINKFGGKSLKKVNFTEIMKLVFTRSGLRPWRQLPMAEEPSRSVKSWLVTSNQFPRKSCGRKLCPWLAREEDCQERCYLEGVTCLARCRRCRQGEVQEGVEEREIVD